MWIKTESGIINTDNLEHVYRARGGEHEYWVEASTITGDLILYTTHDAKEADGYIGRLGDLLDARWV